MKNNQEIEQFMSKYTIDDILKWIFYKETIIIQDKLKELESTLPILSYVYYTDNFKFHNIEIEPYSVLQDNEVYLDALLDMQSKIHNLIIDRPHICTNTDKVISKFKRKP